MLNRGGNLGTTAQKPRRRSGDPMAVFDSLPAPARRWLAEAALPWSPLSCRRLWLRARRAGALSRMHWRHWTARNGAEWSGRPRAALSDGNRDKQEPAIRETA
ncbi:DUF6525 family protein [Paracoccus methylarcula]|uniref:DUF6525 family protein n=1 Tax=Paracoccus methylarcula TaxID=72022 RepID=UPI00344C69A3